MIKPTMSQKELEEKMNAFAIELAEGGYMFAGVAVNQFRAEEDFKWLDTHPEEPFRAAKICANEGYTQAALWDLICGMGATVQDLDDQYEANKMKALNKTRSPFELFKGGKE